MQFNSRFRADLDQAACFESRFWEFHVWQATHPVVAVHDGNSWWILEVAPDSADLCASVGFEFATGRPVLLASLPASERPYRPTGNDYTMPVVEESTAPHFRKIEWSFRAATLEGDRRSIVGLLKECYHAHPPRQRAASPADCARTTRNAILEWHYNPEHSYFRYTMAFDRVGQQIAEGSGCSLDRHEMPLGWVIFQALIDWASQTKDADTLGAVEKVWAKQQNSGLVSPSGYWWTRFAPSQENQAALFDSKLPGGMDGNWMVNPEHLHPRTLGDAVWRAASSLCRHGTRLPFADALKKQVLSQANRVATLAKNGWPLPLNVHAETGKPAGLRGTAGMIWISVWSELAAMGLWTDGALIAQGLDHHRADVESGELFGAPEYVGERVTSEDIYIALNACIDGYRVTGRPEDLATAIVASEWIYLWRKSFHHKFDPRTIVGTFKNNQLHLYWLDAEESLLELARITGDHRWRELADDHWEFAAQLTPLVDGQFNAYEGMVTEQFYSIDWSALGNFVRFLEDDTRRAAYDVGPYYRNHGNLAGFSHARCTAFVLRSALRRGNPVTPTNPDPCS